MKRDDEIETVMERVIPLTMSPMRDNTSDTAVAQPMRMLAGGQGQHDRRFPFGTRPPPARIGRPLSALSRLLAVRCCPRQRRLRLLATLVGLVFAIIVLFTSPIADAAFGLSAEPTSAEERADALVWNASLSVAVSHEAPLTSLDRFQKVMRFSGLASSTAMRRTQLPSWTMHVVEAECTECLDSATHAAAVARQLGNAPAPASGVAVFATPSAPLGLAGPMLFAMASVTDDVAVGAELSLWSWVGRSYGVRRHFAGASPAGVKGGTTPYLVVMGIPSTDQPIRASLRDAQRATWLSYRDVARSENDFNGALLPLYIFAAAEREVSQGVTDTSPLLPTVAEYEAASALLLSRHDDATAAVLSYTERRVQLVPDVKGFVAGDARLAGSPCAQIVERSLASAADVDATWMSKLASALSLPVRPAAVAPAAFICHTSTALWQEALAHRNMVWVDMMTDRRPTSGKKMGQSGNWGLPVEVGMTQKTVLWLEYAYHAFPDVPYIMKSDDDTYLKVPQFLRDMRYIRAGFRNDKMYSPDGVRDPSGIEETEECIYWGGWARNSYWNHLRYHGGNGYLLHRRLVQVVVEDTNEVTARTLRYAVTPFTYSFKDRYLGLLMHVEDMFVARVLRDRQDRLHEVCPFKRALYIEEPMERMLDTHVWMNISWLSTLLHHVTPFDQYYLHYYFHNEYRVAKRISTEKGDVEGAEVADAVAYMVALLPETTSGYGKYTKLQWKHPERVPFFYVSPEDKVAVYSIEYEEFSFEALDKAYHSVFV